MKKIVIDARISGTTTGRYVDKLVEYLHKLSSEYEFVVLTRDDRIDYMKSVAPNFTVTPSNFVDFSFGEQLGLNKQLRKLKADLVHFPMVQQPLMYREPTVTSMLDLTTTRFKNPSKNSAVFTVKQSIYKVVNRIVAQRTAHIITISEYVKNDLMQAYKLPPEKLTTTYCAADKITDAPEEYEDLKGKEFIMYVGRPMPHKNLGRLIDAHIQLLDKYPNLKLVLVGKKDALFEEHEEYVRLKGVSNSVVFTDFASEGQLRWLYENCQTYVFPSLSEGFGLPGLEAMVHGAPVLSSNATCLPEIYDNAAHYFDPTNIDDMALKISEVLDSDKLRESLISKGYEQVKKYSWQRMAEQTLEVYKLVIK